VSQQPGSDPQAAAQTGAGAQLLALYDRALPEVYGYLLARCGTQVVAEDLTAETFLAAVDATRGDLAPQMSTGWLVGVARHKLADHWRQQSREERKLRVVASDPRHTSTASDPWEAELDAVHAHQVLAQLAPQHRLALTLRYVDDLPVPRVAETIDRSVHATEALLMRAKEAFRRAYTGGKEDDRD
jgi:RNA polymerase sigma-70 factor (ECF subfamily)